MGCDVVAMLLTYSIQTYRMLCVPLSCFKEAKFRASKQIIDLCAGNFYFHTFKICVMLEHICVLHSVK